MINKKQVQQVLRDKIKEKGIQKQQLAEKIGVCRETISYYLNSTSHHFITAIKLLNELDIDVKEFYKTKEKETYLEIFVGILQEFSQNLDDVRVNFKNNLEYKDISREFNPLTIYIANLSNEKYIDFECWDKKDHVIFCFHKYTIVQIEKNIATFENDFINKVLNEVKKEIF